MSDRKKHRDLLPEEFATYEEAAEFWDTHDTTDYPEAFRTVAVETELCRRHYEVEIDTDLVQILREQAQIRGTTISHLVSSILRQQFHLAAL
jgi:vacuolar-type H+-ATPase subunit B/Vma2